MKIDGACLCGHVTYEADVDPQKVTVCHCTDCQIGSATAFRTIVPVARGDFVLKTGVLKTYVKTAESGRKRALGFCPECGTAIHGGDPVDPQVYSLRVGTARQRHQLAPGREVWRRSAVGWLASLGHLPGHERQP